MDIDAREFGRLEGEVQALGATLAAQNVVLAELKRELAAVNVTLSEAKGGWRVLLIIGGASATAATAVNWLLQHIAFKVGT